jgi:hypothetical protein
MAAQGSLTVVRGAALHVGALIGHGALLVPALAASLLLTVALAVFSARFLAVPAVAGLAAFALHRVLTRRSRRAAPADPLSQSRRARRPMLGSGARDASSDPVD